MPTYENLASTLVYAEYVRNKFINRLLIRFSTVVNVDIRPRDPTFCTSIKNDIVCERTVSIRQAYARCTQQVSYAYVKVR